MSSVRSGDRFRVVGDCESSVMLGQYAPAHSHSVPCVVPAGTVLVALDQVPGATGFGCYPEDYDRMESVLIPEGEREDFSYAGSYYLSFRVSDIGHTLQPIAPLDPRPPSRLWRVTGRPTERQQADLDSYSALTERIESIPLETITQVGERSWVRGAPSEHSYPDWKPGAPGPTIVTRPTSSWEMWFGDPPGDPPRSPDATQPGGRRGVVGRVWRNDASSRNLA
jgi:hypothetical protein